MSKFARLRGTAGGLRQPEVSGVLNESGCGVSGFVNGSLSVLSSGLPQDFHLMTVAVEVTAL